MGYTGFITLLPWQWKRNWIIWFVKIVLFTDALLMSVQLPSLVPYYSRYTALCTQKQTIIPLHKYIRPYTRGAGVCNCVCTIQVLNTSILCTVHTLCLSVTCDLFDGYTRTRLSNLLLYRICDGFSINKNLYWMQSDCGSLAQTTRQTN